ncbi:class I SAM-dependent methyltransferase [Sorangium sp. So ce1128]
MAEAHSRDERWKIEAEFFDEVTKRTLHQGDVVDPLALSRYSAARLRKRFNKEFSVQALGDLHGKRLLDVGCGDGDNTVLFAKLGAQATGIDISPGAVDRARRRARVNGVEEQTRFVCTPIETANIEDNSFDIIWCNAILHHMITELPLVMDRLTRWAKPGALLLFAEPINLTRTLRRLRTKLPIPTDATPDERPLESAELSLIRSHLIDAQERHFLLLARLKRFILVDRSYERASPLLKALMHMLYGIDSSLLSLPALRGLAGLLVLYGAPRKGAGATAAAARPGVTPS